MPDPTEELERRRAESNQKADAFRATRDTLNAEARSLADERGLIVEALKSCRNNRSEAARRLGLSRATLHDKLKKYALAGQEASDERAADEPSR